MVGRLVATMDIMDTNRVVCLDGQVLMDGSRDFNFFFGEQFGVDHFSGSRGCSGHGPY